MPDDSSEAHDLIYDWNLIEVAPQPERVMVTDETLRDGLQSSSVTHPEIQDKVYLLYLMHELRINAADLGLCGAGDRFKYDVTVLAREIATQHMSIQPQSAARTIISDIAPIADASQDAGIPIEAAIFVGTSPIRQYAEGWDLDFLLARTEESVKFAIDHGLPVMFVTEDTTRAHPETLRKVYIAAIQAGAQRICVSDTVGHATPLGVKTLIRYIRGIADEVNPAVGIDWHGHRDRGLDVINTVAAIEAGADRVHACGLGIGERSGNTPMEILLVNLNLLGWSKRDLVHLPDYCKLISEKCGTPIPYNYPVVGADSFRTSTGVHAAAVVKALSRNDTWLADRVYCSVPASMVGRAQSIEIGPMSGEHNVRYFLMHRDIEAHPIYIEKILAVAKRSNRTLSENDVLRMVAVMRARLNQSEDIYDDELQELLSKG
ncbi:MAG TPA: LeuA family protein [Anaerolineales bacterium]|nr:LeuA family protein [Anaerolineales bacterium]